VFLPFRADTLICGLLAGLAIHSGAIQWNRYILWIRIAPILMLVLTALSHVLGGLPTLEIFAPLFLGIGCAAFILSLVLGAPEARRFQPRLLQRIGDNSYCLYLTHLTVLGLMHGLILGRLPDVQTPAQWAVTFASLPVAGLVAFVMTRYIEEPLTRYGRNWKWSRQKRPAESLAAPQVPQIG
jgi:peptidoglycan/LPS O-acetylase OafA/YrhL